MFYPQAGIYPQPNLYPQGGFGSQGGFGGQSNINAHGGFGPFGVQGTPYVPLNALYGVPQTPAFAQGLSPQGLSPSGNWQQFAPQAALQQQARFRTGRRNLLRGRNNNSTQNRLFRHFPSSRTIICCCSSLNIIT